MDSQITGALTVLALGLIASIGLVATALANYLKRRFEVMTKRLDENTELTIEARDLSNGRLGEALAKVDAALAQLEAARKQAAFFRAILDEMQAYPEARAFINKAAEAVRERQHDPHTKALARLLDGETPT